MVPYGAIHTVWTKNHMTICWNFIVGKTFLNGRVEWNMKLNIYLFLNSIVDLLFFIVSSCIMLYYLFEENKWAVEAFWEFLWGCFHRAQNTYISDLYPWKLILSPNRTLRSLETEVCTNCSFLALQSWLVCICFFATQTHLYLAWCIFLTTFEITLLVVSSSGPS